MQNELNGNIKNLNIDKVWRTTVYAIEKGDIYINNKLNKDKR